MQGLNNDPNFQTNNLILKWVSRISKCVRQNARQLKF